MNKRFLAWLLVFLMTVSLLPLGLLATVVEAPAKGLEDVVIFTIGKEGFTVGEKVVDADAAPYIKTLEDGAVEPWFQ